MSTVTKQIADDVIAGKYEEGQCVKIVKYENAWGGESYGLIFKGMSPDHYVSSAFVRNPTTYWEKGK